MADGPNAEFFSAAIENTAELVVPTVSVYDVSKRVLLQRDEGDALQAAAAMMQGTLVELDLDLALDAARLSAALKLPMADSMILATARRYDAVVWTQDADFEGLDGVRYTKK